MPRASNCRKTVCAMRQHDGHPSTLLSAARLSPTCRMHCVRHSSDQPSGLRLRKPAQRILLGASNVGLDAGKVV